MNNIEEKGNDIWGESPITGKLQVLCEYDEKNGESQMDLSSGFYTNEYPLNYKKNPDFDIESYESKMPSIMKELRFDDGESYWYPSTLRTPSAMVFPVGNKESFKWCYAEVKALTEEEAKIYSQDINYESKLDMDNAKYYDRYLDAIKNIKGYSLGDIS